MLETWHLTIQDPIAVTLVVLGVALAVWLQRRLPSHGGCGGCPTAESHAPTGPAAPRGTVALSETRLGRRAPAR